MIEMKKMMLAAMAAMVIGSTGTALAATPGAGFCRDNAPAIETSYAHCGDGYHGSDDGYHGRGHGHGGRHGGGYCWGNENNNEG